MCVADTIAMKRRLDDVDVGTTVGRERFETDSSLSSHYKSTRLDSAAEFDSSFASVRKTCDLVVLNLPFKTTNDALKAYFEKFGEVVVAEVRICSE